MAIDDCNADGLANELYTSLTSDAPDPPSVDFTNSNFSFTPDLNSELYANISSVSLDMLTEVDLEGNGVFDKLMSAVDIHIKREFDDNRITGTEYTKVYTAVMGGVLSQSTSFLLQKDQAKWAAITAQMQGRIVEIQATEALINLEKTKAETQKMIFDMKTSGANYALTKMNLANADAQHCLIKAQVSTEVFKRNFILPSELAIKEYTRTVMMPTEYSAALVNADRILPAEAAIKEYQNRVIQPIEAGIQKYQLDEIMPLQQETAQYTYDNMLPISLGQEQHKLNFQMPAQTDLIKEQREVQRGQTLDKRSDNLTPISGILGKQKESIVQDIITKQYNMDEVLPSQVALVNEQTESERSKTLDTRTDNTVISGVVGKQKLLTVGQIELIKEQQESERSKTMDTRTDGSTLVEGSVGKQKDLYDQQIDSFIKDAKHKTAKMYLDGWITAKTLDENLATPNELDVPSISSVLLAVRNANSL